MSEGSSSNSPGNKSAAKPGTALSRRTLLAGSAGLVPLVTVSCSTTSAPSPLAPANSVLAPDLNAALDAFADRILPPDSSSPGAAACGIARYVNRSLAEWNQADVPLVSAGLQSLDAAARARHRQAFSTLASEQQDELLIAMEAGQLEGFANAQAVFNRLHRLVLEGMFSDPYYGGNANYAGWDLIGYPGAVLGSSAEMQEMGGRLPPLHTSAYGADFDGDAGAQHDGH